MATGIVRRIDELGRLVIPRETRRRLRMCEGALIEVFVDADGAIVLKKYSSIGELSNFIKEYARTLYDKLNQPILVGDRDKYIATFGTKGNYAGEAVSDRIDEIITNGKSVLNKKANIFTFGETTTEKLQSYAIVPIIANGDGIGAVIIFSRNSILSEIELQSIEIAAHFIGKQMEDW